MAYTSKAPAPKPPLKGAFPLDHDGECKKQQEEYMACLSANNNMATMCRDASKAYLECRMKNNLMLSEPVEKLGFNKEVNETTEEFNRRMQSGELKIKKR
jgi:cytochrome c oxidase assembly protein subunit 19